MTLRRTAGDYDDFSIRGTYSTELNIDETRVRLKELYAACAQKLHAEAQAKYGKSGPAYKAKATDDEIEEVFLECVAQDDYFEIEDLRTASS